MIVFRFSGQNTETWRTDGQTDGQTSRAIITAVCSANNIADALWVNRLLTLLVNYVASCKWS